MGSQEVQEFILEELRYLRSKLDGVDRTIQSIIWKVVSIGAGSGALGFIVALLVNRLV